MDKDLAIAHLLVNFSYIDGEITKSEIKKIKEIFKKLKISIDIDTFISEILPKINDDGIKEYGEALAILNSTLGNDEKINLLKSAVEIIEADGKIMDKEIFKLHFVATNWGLDIKKVL